MTAAGSAAGGEAATPAADSPLALWLAHLEALHPKGQSGIELGLERVVRVKQILGQDVSCPLITVGGTNGKGSTCAYLEAIYSFAGYRVGCYTSPHLIDFNERTRIDRQAVDDATLARAFACVESARQAAGATALTYFEFATLAAVEVFRACQAEVVILEVGLGGRLDAVNAYDADCAIVTSIALDHTEWLGNTRAAIGVEKAGIFRPGRPALCADPEPPASLVEYALAIGADLHLLGRDFGYFGDRTQWTFWGRDGLRRGGLANPALRGRCQLRNASVALAAGELLRARLPLSMQAVRRGLIELQLPGRFQVLPGRPTIVLDVAHNPQAVGELASNLADLGYCARTFAVVGMLADKDIAASLAPLAGKIDQWMLTDLAGPRAATAAHLASFVGAGLGGACRCFVSPGAAFDCAAKMAKEDDRIVVFGSFQTVAAVMQALNLGR